jgi:hypothetical protein
VVSTSPLGLYGGDAELSSRTTGLGAAGAQPRRNDYLCRCRGEVIVTEHGRKLVIGASYGLLTAAKLAASGQSVSVVGLPDEVAGIKSHGVSIRFANDVVLAPPMGFAGIRLITPEEVDVAAHDMVFLAVQEPQAGTAGMTGLLGRIGDRLPVAALMNMPPPPFLDRVPGLPHDIGREAYCDTAVWARLPAERMTLASPDA